MREHAAARHVAVHLHFTDASICLEVLDDGVGFDPGAVPDARRGGLAHHGRTHGARIGGKLAYEKAPGTAHAGDG